MYFELQLSAEVFTRIVRNRLKALSLCVDRELSDKNGTRLVVDQVVVGNSTFIQREKTIDMMNGVPTPRETKTQSVWIFSPRSFFNAIVPFLQVKQELLIHLVKSADLDLNGPNPTPPFQTITLYPIFNVSLKASNQTQGGGPLTLSYSLAQVDFGFLFLTLSETERALIQQFIAAVQLPSTTVDLGPLTALLKRPVAAVNAGITCDSNASLVALRVDFDVQALPTAVSREFFESGPTNMLAARDWAMLIDANLFVEDARVKATNALKADAKVKLNSGPHVSWDPSGPAIDITAGVELVDACPFFVDDIDMDADVDIRVSFSVPSPNILRTHFNITAEPSDLGEEIACALTGALLWPFIGPLFLKGEEIGEGLGAYFGGLAGGPLVTFIGIIAAIETKSLNKDISRDLGSTCKKQNDENYECNDVMNLMLSLSPPLPSKLELNQAFGVPEGLVISGFVRNLPERKTGSVTVDTSPFQWIIAGKCGSGYSIVNEAQIRVAGTLDGALCRAYVLEDPLNEFVVTAKDGIVDIRSRFQPAYTNSPYACRVRVITNRGVRTITFLTPTAITDAEREHLELMRHSFGKVCQIWRDSFHERVEWKPERPGPVEHPSWQFWQFVVKGMRAEDIIRVEGPQGDRIMTARPTHGGVAHFSLMFPGERRVLDLSLHLVGLKGEERQRRYQLSQQQVQFERRASLPLHGALHAMRFEGSARNRRLIVLDDEQELMWNVTVPQVPVLLSSTVRTEDRERADMVVHTGKRVGGAATPRLLHMIERLRETGLSETIASPRVGGIAETLYSHTEEGPKLLDISSSEEPREVHSYEKPAWYPGVALGGKLMAKHDLDRNAIDLYVAIANVSL